MSTSTTRAVEAAMRLADELKMSPRATSDEWVEQVQADYEIVQTELVRLRAALDEIDAMNPDDFRTGQGHLPPAFREVSFPAAFQHVCGVVNKVLHNTDAYGNPLLPDGTPGG